MNSIATGLAPGTPPGDLGLDLRGGGYREGQAIATTRELFISQSSTENRNRLSDRAPDRDDLRRWAQEFSGPQCSDVWPLTRAAYRHAADRPIGTSRHRPACRTSLRPRPPFRILLPRGIPRTRSVARCGHGRDPR